jgi:phospholipase A-2-activating protein
MYTVAEKFLLRNELPTTYTDQIVKFLETNTQGATIGTGSSVDPFTGNSSYKASGEQAGSSTNHYRDPFTGSGAYTAGSSEKPCAGEPAGASPTISAKPFQPIRSPQYFATINIEPVKKKIAEFASQLSPGVDSGSRLVEMCDRLIATHPSGTEVPASQDDVAYLMRLASDWPVDKRFPGQSCPEFFQSWGS